MPPLSRTADRRPTLIRVAAYPATLALLAMFTASTNADNWTRFRGDSATGVAAPNAHPPVRWSKQENIRWFADVPGWGWSCPIVWKNKVFLTTVTSEEKNLAPSKGLYLGQGVRDPAKGVHHWLVYCFDLNTGSELWKREAHAGQPKVPRHPKSTYAAETATTDGERLYVLFGDLGLYCFDLNGKPLWSRAIEPRKTAMDYGAAASPVVHDGQVFVVYDNLEESWIAAFDAKTGEDRWRKKRNETHSWATPFIWKNQLRTEIVTPGKNRNRSYSLDGELLWEFNGRMSNLVIPSPFAAHGMCYIASGYIGDRHRPTFAIKPGASGDITTENFTDSEFIEWYQPQASSYNPSQTVYGDYLYTCYDRGFLTCHDAKTGKEVYGKKRFAPRGSFTASPLAANGYLYFLSEDGLTYVVKAGPEFEIIERNELGELSMACPAAVGRKLLIRTASKLYCFEEGARLPADRAALLASEKTPTADPDDVWAAARSGNVEQLAKVLTAGNSVDAQNNRGETPLMMTALYGRTDAAAWLLNKGANAAIRNHDGNSALHMAAFMAHPDIVKLLLKQPKVRGIKNGKQETALNIASGEWTPAQRATYRRIAELLGVDVDLQRVKRDRQQIAEMLENARQD